MKPLKTTLSNCILVITSTIFAIALAEGLLWLFLPIEFNQDERNMVYSHDQDLGWFSKANNTVRFGRKNIFAADGRVINIKTNSLGFRDDEYVKSDKPTLVFIGDSFVWGYEVEKEERFTEKLRKKIENYEIYNLGVSGYGTDQEFLILQEYFDVFNPQIVFLIFCTDNDRVDNTTNHRYGSYFKPYFTVNENDELQLNGVPVPYSPGYYMQSFHSKHNIGILMKSQIVGNILKLIKKTPDKKQGIVEVPDPTGRIFEEIKCFVENKGAQFIVGLTDHDEELEKTLTKQNIPHIDLSNDYRYDRHGFHWTPSGHDFVTDKIEKFLLEGNYLSTEQQLASPL